MRLRAGVAHRLGATWDGRGVNFALFSAHAEKVELCLFDSGGKEQQRIALSEGSGGIWHFYLDGAAPGQQYGYRVHGPYEPQSGRRFNPNKLLLDPYARQIAGHLELNEMHFGYHFGDPRADLSYDTRDNAADMVKAVVAKSAKEAKPASRPGTSWSDTIIYEAHVAGLTRLRNDVPPHWRGTFRALYAPAIIAHLKRLGVTAIELLPVHAFIDDWFVKSRGLGNYWGYNTLGFFAPHGPYLGGEDSEIIRTAVDRLHDAGIEVLLDVVYNHSCEGDHLGPTLSFRGIDNLSYYRLLPGEPRYYENFTGTGNVLNLSHPQVLRMAIDSLRHWAETFHVDGFRFDLGAALARGPGGFDGQSPFFAAIRADPLLGRLKLIAEPWDIGPGGYRRGQFPKGWSEWNDAFRKGVRRFWLSDGDVLGEMGRRMTGSSGIFRNNGRMPTASINFVTAHDGFTLADLVSYAHKHNERNLEGNRDGESHNDSTNCGVEGPTGDETVIAARRRSRKNLLATLLLARGVPMLLAGDEAGNSQAGNNNAYCQDNEIGWVKWSASDDNGDGLTGFIAQMTALRRRFPQLRADKWLEGWRENGTYDILWLTSQGTEMTPEDWEVPDARFLSYVLGPVRDGDAPLYIVLNAAPEIAAFRLPEATGYTRWALEIETCERESGRNEFSAGTALEAPARSIFVFSAIA